MSERFLFEVVSKLGVKVRATEKYWKYIVTVKHPPLKGLEEAVKNTLRNLIETRRSR